MLKSGFLVELMCDSLAQWRLTKAAADLQGLTGSLLPGGSPALRFNSNPEQFSRLPGGMRVVSLFHHPYSPFTFIPQCSTWRNGSRWLQWGGEVSL